MDGFAGQLADEPWLRPQQVQPLVRNHRRQGTQAAASGQGGDRLEKRKKNAVCSSAMSPCFPYLLHKRTMAKKAIEARVEPRKNKRLQFIRVRRFVARDDNATSFGGRKRIFFPVFTKGVMSLHVVRARIRRRVPKTPGLRWSSWSPRRCYRRQIHCPPSPLLRSLCCCSRSMTRKMTCLWHHR